MFISGLIGSLLVATAVGAAATAGAISSKKNRQQQQEQQEEVLSLQERQYQHQVEYDEWQKQQTERNYQLQSHPISTLLNDGSSVGVNPMAALGQNVGSVSVPSSNASTGFGTSPIPDTLTPSLFSMLSSLSNNVLSIQAEKSMKNKDLDYKYQELKVLKDLRNRELDIAETDSATRQGELGVHQGQLKLNQTEVNKRFEELDRQYNLSIQRFDFDKAMKKISNMHLNKMEALEERRINNIIDNMHWAQEHGQNQLAEHYFRDAVVGVAGILGGIGGLIK